MGNLARLRGKKFFDQDFVTNQMFSYINLKINDVLRKN